MATATAKTEQNGNGKVDPLTEAILYEQQIAEEAAGIREDATTITPELLAQLLPLLRKPIPKGFIVTTPSGPGKPYESTGIKSMQVQINRLDNVLLPFNWSWHTAYDQEGKLAEVMATIWQGHDEDRISLVTRHARGGMNQASTLGNLYKGSETNAAKLCFARLGPGHEVYVGATDYDPDVNEDAAGEQAKIDASPKVARIEGERVAALIERVREWIDDTQDADGQKTRTRRIRTALGSVGAAGKTDSERIASLTPKQADEFEKLLDAEIGGGAQ